MVFAGTAEPDFLQSVEILGKYDCPFDKLLFAPNRSQDGQLVQELCKLLVRSPKGRGKGKLGRGHGKDSSWD